jgi:hypothetical protein
MKNITLKALANSSPGLRFGNWTMLRESLRVLLMLQNGEALKETFAG